MDTKRGNKKSTGNRVFPKVHHSGHDARIVLEQNKFNVKCIQKGVDELFEENVVFTAHCAVGYTAGVIDDQGNVEHSVAN